MTTLTPSRHPAGSPIPLDGATGTDNGFDTGQPAPQAAPAPDTVAGAAHTRKREMNDGMAFGHG